MHPNPNSPDPATSPTVSLSNSTDDDSFSSASLITPRKIKLESLDLNLDSKKVDPDRDPDFKDIPTPLAKHFTRLKRKSITAWNTLSTEMSKAPKQTFRSTLRNIAPLRFWLTLVLLIALIISLLLWMIIKEDQTIKTISKTLENVDSGSKTWKRGIKPVIMVVAFGVISSGLNGYLMWRVAMAKSLQAEVAAEAAVAAERLLKVAPTFMERNFPIISAILPSNSHEVVLYIINFLMICQGYNVWQNWRHSPVAGAIRRWQSTGLNKMLRKRELRRIARRAEKELARGAKAGGEAAFAFVRGGGLTIMTGKRLLNLLGQKISRLTRLAVSLVGVFMGIGVVLFPGSSVHDADDYTPF
ncbi:hypothetical protein TrLO_g3109 [Triparma laevis f. longispina]|uniref:Uncharacterized protein n=1 Tax=Triparma laevis f. longispina TaxID=1714387 RepID=A0A9W7KVC9_9STRA|nr:hypothetical protein TrLO_g3109 [Triparma laevis f. longispina]